MTENATLEFDLSKFLRTREPEFLSDIPWDEIPNYHLSEDEIFCLHYMMDIETHTALYMSTLLETPAKNDPDVTAFLMIWGAEEFWHGEAFSRFLKAYGIVNPPEPRLEGPDYELPSRPVRTRQLRESLNLKYKFGQLVTKIISKPLGRSFIATHNAWGAINELTTLTSYHQLIRLHSDNKPLLAMLEPIIEQERMHFANYRQQAVIHLKKSRFARALTKFIITNFWTPVGVGVKTWSDLDVLMSNLFLDEEGLKAIAYMDSRVNAMLGFDANLLAKTCNGTRKRMKLAA